MIDVRANRKIKNYTVKEYFLRFLWSIFSKTLLLIPNPLYAPKRLLLKCFGAHIGKNVHIHSSVKIMCPWNLSIGNDSAIGSGVILYCLGIVRIGERVTISQYSHLCAGTHDYKRADRRLLKLPIDVCDDVWVCANVFIGPNVAIGSGSIVGAGSVVTREISSRVIVQGNPAQTVRKLI
tara:strand:- start:1454 stop:1990 length:537 start_codon:yes stop_codon:yes gene_type:complete